MGEFIDRVARAMYWDRVNPSKSSAVTLSVAVQNWEDLADEHRAGLQVWHCKSFWLSAARGAIAAMREPINAMLAAGIEAHGHFTDRTETTRLWQAMIDAALKA